MSAPLPHPLNPVAKDQTFLTCKGCQHGKFYDGKAVGRCRHPDNMIQDIHDPEVAIECSFPARIQMNGMYINTTIERINPPLRPGFQYAVVTDLQVCSKWEEAKP